nr:uncharacterized mitochondrial protein AtMg00810-like [Tanacetum cinerariifolium]
MPPKPDLVFHDAPNVNELSPTKPDKDLSPTNRPSAPIIKDWVSDSEDDSKADIPQNAPITAAAPKLLVTKPRQAKTIVTKPHLPPRRHINHSPSLKASNFSSKFTTAKAPMVNVVKAINGGYVAFGGNLKGGKISREGKIKTGKLDFDDVYSVKELKFNLFSVLQMCDKKNNVLFTSTECIVLSHELKLPDENQVLLRATLDESNLWHRRLGHINFKTMNKVVKGIGPKWLFDIDSLTMSMNYQPVVVRNQPNDNAGIKENLDAGKVRKVTVSAQQYVLLPLWSTGLQDPQNTDDDVANAASNVKENENDVHVSANGSDKTDNKKHDDKAKRDDKRKSLVDSLIGVKDLRAEFKEFSFNSSNRVNAVSAPVNAVGPNLTNNTNNFNTTSPYVNAVSLNFRITGKSLFMNPSKYPDDPDMPELEDIIYSDDEKDVGAKAELSNLGINIPVSPIPTTRVHKDHPVNQIIGDLNSAPQTRSMTRMVKEQGGLHQINDEDFHTYSLLPISFWAEAVNTVCYVQNRVLVTKPQNKTPYELLHGRTPSIGFMRPFGYPVTILNTQDSLGKFNGKVDEGFLVRYSVNSKAFRVFNSRTRIVQETLHIHFLKKKPNVDGSGPTWLFDIDTLTKTMNYQPVTIELEDITHSDDEEDVGAEADFTNLETSITVFRNKKDERGIVVKNKAQLVAQGHTQEKGIDYKEVFAPVARIEAIRQQSDILLVQIYVDNIIFGSTNKDLCKAFEKLMKDKFQMSLMGELTFFLGLQVKQKKDGIFISQYKYVAEILRKFRLTDGKSASTLIDTKKPLLKDLDGEDVDVHTYRSMIGSLMYLTSHLHAVKSIFRYLKGKPHLGLWYPKVSPFNLVTYLDSDYAEGIDCLPNEEILAELSKMGYKKPSTKLTFYKAFFSPQWKFLIHTILQCMSAKRTSWNEFSSSMASAVICLSTGRKFNFSKYIFDSLARNVDNPMKFYMYPPFLQLMIKKQVGDLSSHSTKYSSLALTQKVFANIRRVGKRFSGVDTPLFKGAASIAVNDVPDAAEEPTILLRTPPTQPPPPSQDIPSTSQVQPTPPQSPQAQPPSSQQQPQPSQDAEISMDLLYNLVKKLERRNKLKVSKLMRLKKVGTTQRVETSDDTVMDDVSKQGRIIANMDVDEDVTLKDVVDIAKEVAADAEIKKSADDQGRKTESQAQIYQINLEHADKVLSMQDDDIEPAELQEVVEVVTTAKLITEVVTAASATITVVDAPITAAAPVTFRSYGDINEDGPSTIIHTEPKSKDKGKGIMVHEPKPLKKKTQIEQDEAYAKELEAELNKNIDWDEGRLEEYQAQVYHIDLEHADKVLSMQDDEPEPAELKEVIEVVTTAKLITKVVTTTATITVASSAARRRKGAVIRDPKETATPSIIVHSKPKSKDKRKGILVEEPKPLKKQAQIEQDEAYARELEAELNKNINWDDVIEQVKKKEKEDNAALREKELEEEASRALKRKTESSEQQSTKKQKLDKEDDIRPIFEKYFNSNVAFLEKTKEQMEEEDNRALKRANERMKYDDIRPIFEKYFNSNVDFLEKTKEQMEEEDNRALKRISKSKEDKAAKKQKLDEEVAKLKRHLQTVPNDEDDVYTEATPLALKVPVVDYKIYTENNKPYYKIKRADGTHQLYLSFLSMLRNFDKEDLEVLWKLFKERFASSKPKNFSDDFLLTILRAMFEKPDWKSRIKRYIDTKPNHELIHYCLENPPYKLDWKDIKVPVSEGSPITTTARIHETYKNVSQEIRDQLNAEVEAVQIILTGIDNDIYSTVDACPNACEMWKAIETLKQGESINVQDLESNLYWEFGKFTSQDATDTAEDLDTTLEDPLSNSSNIRLNSKSRSFNVVTVLSA